MTVSILGCGWYGFELAKTLIAKGITVKGSTTTADRLPVLIAAGIQAYMLSVSADEAIYDADFFECDLLWICIPPKRRAGEAEGYPEKVKKIARIAAVHQVKQVVFISSTGVFADGNAAVNEQTLPQPDTISGEALLRAELFLRQQTEFTATILRFAGLVGPGRDPGRFFAGKTAIPNGLAPINLVHLNDCLGISTAIIDQQAYGNVYHACSPHHPSKSEFYTAASLKSGLAAPAFIAEKTSWKIIDAKATQSLLKYTYYVNNWSRWVL